MIKPNPTEDIMFTLILTIKHGKEILSTRCGVNESQKNAILDEWSAIRHLGTKMHGIAIVLKDGIVDEQIVYAN